MNVPHIRQELDYSCLPACVRMILAYYDDQRQESELRRLLKTRITGTSPANVMLRLPDIGYEAIVMDASRLILRKHSDRHSAGRLFQGMGSNWSHAHLDQPPLIVTAPPLASALESAWQRLPQCRFKRLAPRTCG